MYQVKFLKKAVSELKVIDPIWQNRIKPLKGKYSKFLRLRVGNYRIIFKRKDIELIILIIRTAPRSESY
ncbi:MAG: type II toxin-antitoxin system RelE/ParE family toxin [Candidatus Cloacimonetes bacterium]|nr:type II toxin-antitoxin system RelE/ParE family toxin [Candidatus Cloacimonadota bacterium]